MGEAMRTAANLRKALQGELGAITEYEMFAAEADNPRIRELFHHIANDERHHVAEEVRTLIMVDPDQMQAYRDVFGGKRD